MDIHLTAYPTRKAFVAAMAHPLGVTTHGTDYVGCIIGAAQRAGGELWVAGPKNPYSWSALVRIKGETIAVYDSRARAGAKPLVEARI